MHTYPGTDTDIGTHYPTSTMLAWVLSSAFEQICIKQTDQKQANVCIFKISYTEGDKPAALNNDTSPQSKWLAPCTRHLHIEHMK